MSDWLFRSVIRLVPDSWRDAVRADLEQDARAERHGPLWCAWQAIRVALKLRVTFGGGAMLFDLRYALRSLLRARWFTVGAALTFALGIGVNLAVFLAVDQVLFRALPYQNPQDLVILRGCSPKSGQCGGGMFPDLLAQEAGDRLQTLGEFAHLGMTGGYAVSPTGDEPPLRLVMVSPNLLRVLGVRPVAGRDISEAETQEKQVVALLSYEAWQHRYRGNASVLGKPVGPGARSPTIIGILPRGFLPPAWAIQDASWEGLTLTSNATIMAPVARLRPGASREAAQAEIGSFIASLGSRLKAPNAPADAPLPYIRVDTLGAVLFEQSTDYAWLIAATAAIVLLMACANLAGLLLARGRSREHESAIRTALGASSARIVFTSILETAVVCVAGACLALVVLGLTSRALASVLPPVFGRYMADVSDPRVMGAALLISAIAAVVAGLWPGARLARVQVSAVLQRAGREGRFTRLPGGRSLLAVEAALGVVLVLGAALAVRSFVKLATEDLGYRPENLYRVRISLPRTVVPAENLAQYQTLLQMSADVPGVLAVAGGDSVLANGATAMRRFSKDPTQRGARYEVTAGYFQALGGRVLAGREFSGAEVQSLARVVLLNPAGAALLWPGVRPEDLVGRTVTLKDEEPRLVVGVVPGVFRNRFGEEPEAAVYVPLGTEPRSYGEWIVRMAPHIVPSLPAMRARFAQVAAGQSIQLAAVQDALEPSLRDPRFRAVLFGAFAACALLLASAGLYALAAFEVSLRRYEMGVRLTLGATTREIQRLVVFEALRPVVIGAAIGAVVAVWAGKFLQSFLYKVDAHDPWTMGLVALVLIVTAAAAAWPPARRAARTDPAVVLRAQ
jgi:predicted permease